MLKQKANIKAMEEKVVKLEETAEADIKQSGNSTEGYELKKKWGVMI